MLKFYVKQLNEAEKLCLSFVHAALSINRYFEELQKTILYVCYQEYYFQFAAFLRFFLKFLKI